MPEVFLYTNSMQIFHFISVFVPLFISFGLPKIIESSRHPKIPAARIALYVGSALFFVSWYLPSPLIHGEDTSFVTHFVGGGIFTGLLWIYLRYTLRWKTAWYLEALSLFVLVSALGNINEIFELFLVEFSISTMLLTDTNWDILANTLGALMVYLGYWIYDSRD